jgi:hypothetical protein
MSHPEEIECFRLPMPDGEFSPDKRYEYTYATRKSWEYIPLLRRNDWRYFTTKGFTYAGKWLRSERRGWGDGRDCWEVFLDDLTDDDGGTKEKIVSWDYDATLCWRECPYGHGHGDDDDDDNDALIRGVTRKVMDKMITTIGEKTPRISKAIHSTSTTPTPTNWSLIRCIFGCPSRCGLLETAEITTMEPKYRIHDNIAEFWCFITSIFYGSSLLLYLVKEEDWFEGWRASVGWPTYITFSIVISVIVMICSAVYHWSMIEVAGCIDCFFASFLYASVTMTVFGVDMTTQIGALLFLAVIHLNARRYITQLALIIMSVVFPFALLSYRRMKTYYGGIILTMMLLGVACFLMDRMGIAPLHSLWHILSGVAIAVTLYYVVVNGVLE